MRDKVEISFSPATMNLLRQLVRALETPPRPPRSYSGVIPGSDDDYTEHE